MVITDLFETSPARARLVWQKRGRDLTQTIQTVTKPGLPAPRRQIVIKKDA